MRNFHKLEVNMFYELAYGKAIPFREKDCPFLSFCHTSPDWPLISVELTVQMCTAYFYQWQCITSQSWLFHSKFEVLKSYELLNEVVPKTEISSTCLEKKNYRLNSAWSSSRPLRRSNICTDSKFEFKI